jgi:plastocyanin
MKLARTIVMVLSTGAAAVGFPLAVASGQGASRTGSVAGATRAHAAALVDIGAYGNVVDSQDLSFRPAQVTVAVGDVVRWTNHDALVPHTATEDHRLFDLGGDYGATGVTPPGFAPGASVQRTFEAGTFHYYCRVHPTQMHGVVAVAVSLTLGKRLVGTRHHHRTRYTVNVRWDVGKPPAGEVFDVERARSGGAAVMWLTGSAVGDSSFSAPRGTVWHVRARLRRSADPSAATDWSPDAVITAR